MNKKKRLLNLYYKAVLSNVQGTPQQRGLRLDPQSHRWKRPDQVGGQQMSPGKPGGASSARRGRLAKPETPSSAQLKHLREIIGSYGDVHEIDNYYTAHNAMEEIDEYMNDLSDQYSRTGDRDLLPLHEKANRYKKVVEDILETHGNEEWEDEEHSGSRGMDDYDWD